MSDPVDTSRHNDLLFPQTVFRFAHDPYYVW